MKLNTILKESKIIESVSPRIARGKETGDLIVNMDGNEYTVGFPADGYKSPYRIWPPNNDTGFDINKNPTGKKLWAKLKPMVDKYLQSVNEATHTSQPVEWVGYIETPKGDKLMGMFKSAMGAKQWLSKNSNKLLNTDGVERVGIMGIDEWNKFHAKYAIENVNEGARIILINPNTNKFTKTHLYSGPNRDADKEVEKLNSKLTPAQKDKGLYWKISTYENVNEIKKGSVVIPYAMDKYGEFIVDKVFKNKDGETSYTGKFKKSGEDREFILHSKDRIVKERVNKKFGSKYDIGAGSMGSGTTFWNRAQEVDGDYKTIAHVSNSGKVTFYDKKLPNDVKKHIEDYAKTKTESVNENKSYSNNFASWFSGTVLNTVRHPKYGKHKVTPDQIKTSPAEYKDKLFKAIDRVVKRGDITTDMIKKNESVTENSNNKGHWERVGNQTLVDSNFINLSKGVLPNSELVHLGGGDFALKTSEGEIVFSRTPKPVGIADDFVGRVHRMTDNKGGKLLNNLVQLMGKSKKAVLSMSEVVGITEAGCGCGGVKPSNPYSLSEFVVNEARNIQKIQKDYNDTVLKLKSTLEKYKEAKGTPNEKKWIDELKKLTVLKKKYQSELDKGVQDLYKDAEYEGE